MTRKPVRTLSGEERRRRELEQAERWLATDPAQRRIIGRRERGCPTGGPIPCEWMPRSSRP